MVQTLEDTVCAADALIDVRDLVVVGGEKVAQVDEGLLISSFPSRTRTRGSCVSRHMRCTSCTVHVLRARAPEYRGHTFTSWMSSLDSAISLQYGHRSSSFGSSAEPCRTLESLQACMPGWAACQLGWHDVLVATVGQYSR